MTPESRLVICRTRAPAVLRRRTVTGGLLRAGSGPGTREARSGTSYSAASAAALEKGGRPSRCRGKTAPSVCCAAEHPLLQSASPCCGPVASPVAVRPLLRPLPFRCRVGLPCPSVRRAQCLALVKKSNRPCGLETHAGRNEPTGYFDHHPPLERERERSPPRRVYLRDASFPQKFSV